MRTAVCSFWTVLLPLEGTTTLAVLRACRAEAVLTMEK